MSWEDHEENIVLDASVLIGYLTSGDAHVEAARQILNADEWVGFSIHPHTLAESLVLPIRQGAPERLFAALRNLGIERWEPDNDYPARIAAIRVETGLGLADCCPLDVAEQIGATLATFDERLARAARERGVQVVGA